MVVTVIKKQEILNNYRVLEKYAWELEEDVMVLKRALYDACEYIESVRCGAIPTFLNGIDSKFFIDCARKKLIEEGEIFGVAPNESSC